MEFESQNACIINVWGCVEILPRELLYQPNSIYIFEMESFTTFQKQGEAIHRQSAEDCT